MNYKNVKVLSIEPVIFLGKDFINNDYRDNEKYVLNKLEGLSFKSELGLECPAEDMVFIQLAHGDDYDPIIKYNTMELIMDTLDKLIKKFNNVKVNLYLNGYINGCGNSVDLSIKEFIEWSMEECLKFEKWR